MPRDSSICNGAVSALRTVGHTPAVPSPRLQGLAAVAVYLLFHEKHAPPCSHSFLTTTRTSILPQLTPKLPSCLTPVILSGESPPFLVAIPEADRRVASKARRYVFSSWHVVGLIEKPYLLWSWNPGVGATSECHLFLVTLASGLRRCTVILVAACCTHPLDLTKV